MPLSDESAPRTVVVEDVAPPPAGQLGGGAAEVAYVRDAYAPSPKPKKTGKGSKPPLLRDTCTCVPLAEVRAALADKSTAARTVQGGSHQPRADTATVINLGSISVGCLPPGHPEYVPPPFEGAEDDDDEDSFYEGDGTFRPDYHTVKREFEETRFLVHGRVVDWYT